MPKFNPKIEPKLRKKFPKHLFEIRSETLSRPDDYKKLVNMKKNLKTSSHFNTFFGHPPEKLERHIKTLRDNMLRHDIQHSKKLDTKKYSKKMPWRNN